ncbi:MAG: LytR C-terminal domain-containing protein, partial [Planktothrix sp.]
DIKSAEALQKSLGFGKVVVESTGFLESDLTIQVGKDWLKKYNLPTPAESPALELTPNSRQ